MIAKRVVTWSRGRKIRWPQTEMSDWRTAGPFNEDEY
jgi:hypothetical protein